MENLHDNWDDTKYINDGPCLADNQELLNEFLDFSDEEVSHALYITSGFWTSGVNKQEALSTFFGNHGNLLPYQTISKTTGIPVEFFCYMTNIARLALIGTFRRLSDDAMERESQTSEPPETADNLDALMDIEISSGQTHQSQQPLTITTEPSGSTTYSTKLLTVHDPQNVLREKIDQLGQPMIIPGSGLEEDVVIPPPIIPVSTPKKPKAGKKVVNRPTRILTGYKSQAQDVVHDVLVYDIPSTWKPEKILAELTLWGKVISINTKLSRKYQSARVRIVFNSFQLGRYDRGDWQVDLGKIPVRWFPASWLLSDRKKYEAFQAVIEDIPDNLTTDRMWENARLHELLSSQTGLKAYKIIKDGTKRKLIVYLDNWINLKNLIGSEVRWDNKLFRWCKHTSPSQKSKSTKAISLM